jgi:mono/diheme cytochrome c family protein
MLAKYPVFIILFSEVKMIRTIKFAITISFALMLLMLTAACATAATPAPTEVPPTPTALQLPTAEPATAAPTTSAPTTNVASGEVAGASLYQVSCAACHGADLKGTTFELDGQKIDVPALAWDDLSATFQTQPARGTVEQQLALAITKGQDETGADLNAMMPHWSSLSQAQVDSLVQYIHTASTAGGAAPTLEPAALNLTGEQLYAAACSACHGDDGAGKTLEMDNNKITTPSLHWGDLTQTYSADPTRGTIAQQVALGITKGQDETGGDLNTMMPHWSFLSQAQVDSLVQYLQTTFP